MLECPLNNPESSQPVIITYNPEGHEHSHRPVIRISVDGIVILVSILFSVAVAADMFVRLIWELIR